MSRPLDDTVAAIREIILQRDAEWQAEIERLRAEIAEMKVRWRMSVDEHADAVRRDAEARLAKVVADAERACPNPCPCGSGLWPCHADSDKAVFNTIALAATAAARHEEKPCKHGDTWWPGCCADPNEQHLKAHPQFQIAVGTVAVRDEDQVTVIADPDIPTGEVHIWDEHGYRKIIRGIKP